MILIVINRLLYYAALKLQEQVLIMFSRFSKTTLTLAGGLFSALALVGCSNDNPQSNEVNIYSSRSEPLIKPLLDEFTKNTGIQVNLLTGDGNALLSRLQNEGENSPADLFLTVDAGSLYRAKTAELFQPSTSEVLSKTVPSHLRDKENFWHGLSMRARPVFYSLERVTPEEITDYLSLADKKWEGRICVRSSDNIYNQSLVAALIDHHGEQTIEDWTKGLVANFARKPIGGDRDQIHAVASGQCDIAIANTYYFGRMINSEDANDKNTAQKVGVAWPAQDSYGTHVNVSGIGLTKHARNTDNAMKLMEFLVSPSSQVWYAEVNSEYPVSTEAQWSETLQSWGTFKADDISMSVLGENNAAAVRVMDRAGWR